MDHSPLLDVHLSAGARLGDRPEAPGHSAPLTFGDVPAEWRAGAEGCALFDAADLGAVHLEGSEAAAFLHRLLANDVRALRPGAGNRNLLLTGKGKVRFDFHLAREAEDGFRLTAQPGRAADLLTALDMYLFQDDVRCRDDSALVAPLELAGPRARACVEQVLGSAAPDAAESFVDVAWRSGTARVVATEVAGAPGLRVDAGPELAAALWEALTGAGATPAGLVARDFLRIECGRALTGVDLNDDIYPQEAGLDDAFSLDKGCYIGQEVVAKIDTYGGLNKRLLPLRVSHDDPIAPGTRLVLEDDGKARDLGVVTSWGYSFALDGGLVLAYVKRRHQDEGTTFRLGESDATATIVAPPRAG
ncbi:MAG: glycine cleavage T C-terminal barrel domain-containing protein [Planctomycetota bacterium]